MQNFIQDTEYYNNTSFPNRGRGNYQRQAGSNRGNRRGRDGPIQNRGGMAVRQPTRQNQRIVEQDNMDEIQQIDNIPPQDSQQNHRGMTIDSGANFQNQQMFQENFEDDYYDVEGLSGHMAFQIDGNDHNQLYMNYNNRGRNAPQHEHFYPGQFQHRQQQQSYAQYPQINEVYQDEYQEDVFQGNGGAYPPQNFQNAQQYYIQGPPFQNQFPTHPSQPQNRQGHQIHHRSRRGNQIRGRGGHMGNSGEQFNHGNSGMMEHSSGPMGMSDGRVPQNIQYRNQQMYQQPAYIQQAPYQAAIYLDEGQGESQGYNRPIQQRGGNINHNMYPKHQFVPQQQNSAQQQQFRSSNGNKNGYVVHRRQFASQNNNNGNQRYVPFEQNENPENQRIENQPNQFQQPQPLTNASRVHRRGRGGRPQPDMYLNEADNNMRQIQPEIFEGEQNHNDHMESSEDQHEGHQIYQQNSDVGHRIIQRSRRIQKTGETGGIDSFGESEIDNGNQDVRRQVQTQRGPASNQNMRASTMQTNSGNFYRYQTDEFDQNAGFEDINYYQGTSQGQISQTTRGGRGRNTIQYRERGQQMTRGGHIDYSQNNQKYKDPVDFILDEDTSQQIQQNNYGAEYEKYGDYQDDSQYPQGQYSQQSKRPTQSIKYRLKTFDDEVESDGSHHNENASDDANSSNRQPRRGPKLIKFKQKKPSERLALSQLKSEVDDKSDALDIYTPQNTQTTTTKIQILKPYQGFEQPEFYQGPQWKFIRQSTNQNSKQKHYEKGDYDKVQYNFPGAEMQDKIIDGEGEQKLYPPIDDFSDEDLGQAGNSSNHRAKVSFNKSTASLSENEKKFNGQSPLQNRLLNIMPNTFEQQKGAKSKKPAISNKTFSFDQKNRDKSNTNQESLLIQGLSQQSKENPQKQGFVEPISMEFAEKFFVQEQDMMIQERSNNKQYFEKYLDDTTKIEEMQKAGLLWKGVVRTNPKFRHRAYVSIKELNIDVLIESYRLMNRAIDGDTVLIELLPVHLWQEMSDQNSLQAKVTTLCQKTGMVQHGMSHLKQNNGDNQAYTNENAIETRIIDKLQNNDENQSKEQSDQLSMSQSQSEDDNNIQNKVSQKQRPKKFVNLKDEDHEGYIASNSDNNIDSKFLKDKKRPGVSIPHRKQSADVADSTDVTGSKICKEEHKLSQSFSDNEDQEALIKKMLTKQEDNQDLWEDLETMGIKGAKAMFSNEKMGRINNDNSQSDQEEESKQNQPAMTIAQFLGKDSSDASTPTLGQKTSSYNRIELNGTKIERIAQINNYGLTLRPLAKVVGLTESPNRESHQMVTLVEIEQESNQVKYSQFKGKESIMFAIPVNQKLPWFILDKAPQEFIQDLKKERDPSHRYYIIKYQDWTITQKRPHCTMIECIGEAGNLKAESLRLLKMHDICSEEYEVDGKNSMDHVHECLKIFAKDINEETQEWKIPQKEIDARVDLRSKRIVSIDPITAKDLDDALSVEHIQDNIYEIGVHIADVSYFVQQGSDLDKEALKRSTSTYFVHKVYPMLPKLLCEKLCSLNPNVDRLAYSIFFRMDLGKGQVDKSFKPKIQRSVIRSCAKWTYELAQDIISGKLQSEDELDDSFKPVGHKFIDIAQDILTLNNMAQARRKLRLDAGSLVFNNGDFNFTLNPETQYPLAYSESPKMESKQLVEEYMLLANILVAEFLFDLCKDRAIMRAHEEITENRKNELGNFFKAVGLDQINLTDPLTITDSIKLLEQQENSRDKITVVNRKMVQNLTMAKYVCIENKDPEEYAHYGLNFNLYTHFTSPIRRYADLLVHRLLTICLKEGENTRDKIDGIDYSEYAETISEKSFNARKASKECQTLFHCLLLKEHGPKVFECLVFDVDTNYLHIYIEELNVNTVVKLRDDERIDQTTFFEDTMQVACSFRNNLLLTTGLQKYEGEAELKKSRQQKKKEEEIRRMNQDNEDLKRRLNKNFESPLPVLDEPEDSALVSLANESPDKSLLSSNCLFSVFDRIKIKVRATDTFPMDMATTLMITEEDMADYEQILEKQNVQVDLGHLQKTHWKKK